jgi:integrase
VDAEGLNSNMLTAGELAAVWNAFREHEPRWFARVAVSAMGGLRPGEVGALTWGDVDLTTGLLRITRKAYRGRVEEQPKTSAGRRSIVLPEAALEILRPLAEGQKTNALMFPSTVGKLGPDGALLKPLRRVAAPVS